MVAKHTVYLQNKMLHKFLSHLSAMLLTADCGDLFCSGHAGQLEDCSKVTVHAEAAGAGLTYDIQKTADTMDTYSHNSSRSSKRVKLNGIAHLDHEDDNEDAESLMSD